MELAMEMVHTSRVAEQTTHPLVLTRDTNRAYACGFHLGYSIGNACVRLGFVKTPQPSLRKTTVLRLHPVHTDRTVPIHPRVLKPYQVPTQHVLDRRALQRAVECACSLPLTKRTLTRLLGHGLLAELVLAVTALLALAVLGTPVTLDDVLRQLAGLATLALELLLVALIGAFAAEILLSGIAVAKAALSD